MSSQWTQTIGDAAAARRAGGRRRINAQRRARREKRLVKLAQLLKKYGDAPGVGARIARELGVSPSVVCRDRQYLLKNNVGC